jgi:hypothetical protein
MNKQVKQAVMEVNTPYKLNVENSQDILKLVYSNGGNSEATIIFHEDSGHSWLQVPHELINQLGIKEYISNYSYRDAKYAYLEEDCDLGKFLLNLGIGWTENEPYTTKELRDAFFDMVPRKYEDHSPIRNKKPY